MLPQNQWMAVQMGQKQIAAAPTNLIHGGNTCCVSCLQTIIEPSVSLPFSIWLHRLLRIRGRHFARLQGNLDSSDLFCVQVLHLVQRGNQRRMFAVSVIGPCGNQLVSELRDRTLTCTSTCPPGPDLSRAKPPAQCILGGGAGNTES